MSELAESIQFALMVNNHTWKKKDGTLDIPTIEEVEDVLKKAREELYSEENKDAGHAMIMIGGLIIKRDNSHLDVYARVGEYNGEV